MCSGADPGVALLTWFGFGLILKSMAFTLEHVQHVRNGHPKEVGVLPDEVARALGWPCPWVYLGKSGLAHIAAEHPDIDDFDLGWIPLAIQSGAFIRVAKSPRTVLVTLRTETDRYYLGALKEAQNGTEIWVSSFYRIDQKRFAKLQSGLGVLRHHK